MPPLDFYLGDDLVLVHSELLVKDMQMFCLEISLYFFLNYKTIKSMIRVKHIFLQEINMKINIHSNTRE